MKVLFSGSFSPWHHAHQHVYDLACKCFGKENVWLGVGNNASKPRHTHNIKFSLTPITDNVIVYEGLTADVVKKEGFDLLIRGIRPGKSLEQEEDLLHWNRKLSGVETILIPTPPELNQLSSSVIRELNSHKIDVLEYVNPDVFYRWMQNGSPTRSIYFGKSCSGKSTYLKNNFITALNCDEMIWNFVELPIARVNFLKDSFKTAFKTMNLDWYNSLVEEIGHFTNWEMMFNFSNFNFIDAAVIGVYWDSIPVELRSKFRLIKVETTLNNRIKFAKSRNVSLEFLECADYFYKDPPFYDKLITIELDNQNE